MTRPDGTGLSPHPAPRCRRPHRRQAWMSPPGMSPSGGRQKKAMRIVRCDWYPALCCGRAHVHLTPNPDPYPRPRAMGRHLHPWWACAYRGAGGWPDGHHPSWVVRAGDRGLSVRVVAATRR